MSKVQEVQIHSCKLPKYVQLYTRLYGYTMLTSSSEKYTMMPTVYQLL